MTFKFPLSASGVHRPHVLPHVVDIRKRVAANLAGELLALVDRERVRLQTLHVNELLVARGAGVALLLVDGFNMLFQVTVAANLPTIWANILFSSMSMHLVRSETPIAGKLFLTLFTYPSMALMHGFVVSIHVGDRRPLLPTGRTGEPLALMTGFDVTFEVRLCIEAFFTMRTRDLFGVVSCAIVHFESKGVAERLSTKITNELLHGMSDALVLLETPLEVEVALTRVALEGGGRRRETGSQGRVGRRRGDGRRRTTFEECFGTVFGLKGV